MGLFDELADDLGLPRAPVVKPPLPALVQRVNALVPGAVQAVLDADGAGANASQGMPFEVISYDFSKGRVRFDRGGVGLVYRRQGSSLGSNTALGSVGAKFSPNALDINLKGIITGLYPGSRIDLPFDDFEVAPSVGSPTTGTASLVVLKRRDVRFEEPVLTASLDGLSRQQTVAPGYDTIISTGVDQTVQGNQYTADVSSYKSVLAILKVSGIVGGTTPTIALQVDDYFYGTSSLIGIRGNAGGTSSYSAVMVGPNYYGSAGTYTNAIVFGQWRPANLALSFVVSGAPTGWSGTLNLLGFQS